MQLAENMPDSTRRARRDIAGHQLFFPDRMFFRCEKGHGEEACLGIMGERTRHAVGRVACRELQPCPFVRVARHRGVPVC